MDSLLASLQPVWGWLTSGALLLVLSYVIANPDKTEIMVAWVFRLGAWIFKGAARASVSKDIQGRIGKASRTLNKAGGEVLPRGLRIKWVHDSTAESLLKDGQVLVRMKDYGGQAQNMAVATLHYVKAGLMPESKIYLDAKVSSSLDLSVARRMLAEEYPDALPYFHIQHVQPLYSNDNDVQTLMDSMAIVDEKGLLFPVFLNQLRSVTSLLWPHHQPTLDVADEFRQLLSFLYAIATKERKADAPLRFSTTNIDLCVVLVGKPETLREKGLDPYERAVDIQVVDRGARVIYLCGFGANVHAVADLATIIQLKPYADKVERYRFTFKAGNQAYSGMCARVCVRDTTEASRKIS